MTPRVASVGPDDDLDQAMAEMDRLDIRHLPVVEGERVVGVLSDRDLLGETGWLAPRERELLESPQRRVRDVMNAKPQLADPDEPTRELASRLALARIGCLPVVEEDRLIGIVTETDVLAACRDELGAGATAASEDPRVSEVMIAEVASVAPGDSAEAAAQVLQERGFRHLPVVDEGRVVGMVSDRDLRQEIGSGGLELSTVENLMSTDVVCLEPGSHLSRAAALLAELPVSCLPVTEAGELKGLVTVTDLLLAFARRLAPRE